MEEDFRQGRIPMPVGEAEFDFDAGGFADEDTSEFAGGGNDFKEELLKGAVRSNGVESSRRGRGSTGRRGAASRQAAKNRISCRDRDIQGEVNAAAEARQSGFARKQSEGRAPVFALLDGDASDGTVGRDVKPDVFAVHEKGLLFRGLILPAHATGAAEVHAAGFETNVTATFGVAFEESGLKGASGKVTSFDGADEGLSAPGGVGKRGLCTDRESGKENSEEENFLHRR